MRGLLASALALLMLGGCLDAAAPAPTRPAQLDAPQRVLDFLTPEGGDTIVVRTYFVEGREPIPDAMDYVASQLLDATRKRAIVLADPVQVDFGPPSTQTNWTSARAYEAFGGLAIPADEGATTLVVVLFDGYGYTSGTTARGFQAEEFLAIFPDTFRNLAGVTQPVRMGVPDPAYDGSGDRQVILHEAGHMLGLVNHGLQMVNDHVDRSEACLCHSSNVESVMNVNVDLVDYALAGLPAADRFDGDDLADIRALQQAYAEATA